MEEVRSNSSQNLGIAALITGIITFVLAVIPCVGVIAVIPGIITVVLASVGLSQANRNNAPRGVILAGLIIGIVAVLISFSQVFVGVRMMKHTGPWTEDIRSAIEDAKSDMLNGLKDNDVNIKIESDGKKIEINTDSKKDDKMKELEDLEGGKEIKNDTVKKAK